MPKDFVLALINYVFHLLNGQIKLLGEGLIRDPVQQSAFYNTPVSFVKNPFIDNYSHLRPGTIKLHSTPSYCPDHYYYFRYPLLSNA